MMWTIFDWGWADWISLLICIALVVGVVFIGIQVYENEAVIASHEDGVVVYRTNVESKTTMMLAGKIFVPITYPERWVLTLEGEDGEHFSIDVDEETFDRVKVGDTIPNPEYKGASK